MKRIAVLSVILLAMVAGMATHSSSDVLASVPVIQKVITQDECLCGGYFTVERIYRSDQPYVGYWCRNHYANGYVTGWYRC